MYILKRLRFSVSQLSVNSAYYKSIFSKSQGISGFHILSYVCYPYSANPHFPTPVSSSYCGIHRGSSGTSV